MILIVVSILYTFLSVCFVVIANRITLIGINQNVYNNINSLDRIGKRLESHIYFLVQKFESYYQQSEYEAKNTTSSFFYYLRKQLIASNESSEQTFRHFLLSDLNLPKHIKHEIQTGAHGHSTGQKIYLCMLYKYKNFKRVEKEEGLKIALQRTVGSRANNITTQAITQSTNTNPIHYPWDIQLVLIDGSKFPFLATLQSGYCRNCNGPDIFINGTNEENASCLQGHQRYILELDFTALDKRLLLLKPEIEGNQNNNFVVRSEMPILLTELIGHRINRMFKPDVRQYSNTNTNLNVFF